MTPARLALLPDFPEEQWPSMDLVAEQLLHGLLESHADRFDTQRVCATYHPRLARVLGDRGPARNVDRLFNRFITYPRFAKKIAKDFDLFHLCDHSYSQVVHALPADRTGVFCHDLDTFRCLLNPAAEPRPRWFRAMARRILRGFQKARIVFHTTNDVRQQILKHGLIDPARLVHAPLGAAVEFQVIAPDNAHLPAELTGVGPFLLHVGSCIPRKRIDVLLDVFAAARRNRPDLPLVKIGGDWTSEQRAQINQLGIGGSVITLVRQSRETLAECYRRAAVVLIPSEAEGFGLPVIEALACGAIVLASDIPVLREVGGDAVVYAPVADIPAWAGAIERLLADPPSAPAQPLRLARAALYSWRRHAAIIADAYASVLTNRTHDGGATPQAEGQLTSKIA